ncbi:MAG: hypothetical protein F4Y57_11020, partial [Acidobacteria bacterium]|nr:hypothetical protein [Acidobacteriota bacterium]
MHRLPGVFVAVLASGLGAGAASAQSFEADVTPLLEASCLQCHGPRTVTPLNLDELGFDITDHEKFRKWQQIYERVEAGEMPPPAARRPDAALVETALGSLKRALVDAHLAARGGPRTPLRRPTR